MNNNITSMRDIINQWPTRGDFARAVNLPVNVIKGFVHRNRIHPRYWDVLIAACEKKGIPNIDHKRLTELYVATDEKKTLSEAA